MIKRFGEFVFKYRLKRRARRTRRAYNLEEAKHIGIIYEQNEVNYEAMIKFVRSLKEKNKNVRVLGFKNEKKKDSDVGLHPDFKILYKNDLNSLQIPKKDVIGDFIKEPFDILIDLSLRKHMCLKYILGMSAAAFKVSGSQDHQKELADLTIEVNKESTINYLLDQIKHYLNMVQQKERSYVV